MKLISMTDFVFLLRNKTTMELCTSFPNVFKEQKWRGSVQESASEFLAIDAIQWRLVGEYAKFLRKPLTLGMFVPCGEDGNFLKEPKEHMFAKVETYLERLDEYEQAKERVLFYGFEKYRVDKRGFLIDDIGFDACEVKSLNKNTIEDLVGRNITLTTYALKQIGI